MSDKTIAELITDLARLQFEAGRVAALIEQHYTMGVFLRETATPIAVEPRDADDDSPRRRCGRITQLVQLLPSVVPAGDAVSSTMIGQRLRRQTGTDVPHDQLHNILRSAVARGVLERVSHGMYQVTATHRINGHASLQRGGDHA